MASKLIDEAKLLFEEFINEKKVGFWSKTTKEIMETICVNDQKLCVNLFLGGADANTENDNIDNVVVMAGHDPAGTSVQNMNYWSQLYLSYKFEMYNYGKEENLKRYNSTTPPLYHLADINVPVYLHAGNYDKLADPTDVEKMYTELTGSPKVVYNKYPYGHMTFLQASNTEFVDKVLETIRSEEKISEVRFLSY